MQHPVEAVVKVVDASVHEGEFVDRHHRNRDATWSLGVRPAIPDGLVGPELDDDVVEVLPCWFAAQ